MSNEQPKPEATGVDLDELVKSSEAFARYHDERASHGGASFELHARASTLLGATLPDVAAELRTLRARVAELETWNANQAVKVEILVRADAAIVDDETWINAGCPSLPTIHPEFARGMRRAVEIAGRLRALEGYGLSRFVDLEELKEAVEKELK